MPRAERELRQLVARLAALPPADVAEILSALDDDRRARVEALLDAYEDSAAPSGGSASAATEGQLAEESAVPAGMAPWFARRLADRRTQKSLMTPRARQALREAVTQVAAARPNPGSRAPQSLGGRLWRLLQPGEAAR